MQIDVRFHGLELSWALHEHTVRKLAAHLGRFRHQLTVVRVRLADVNGPRGGVDKCCRVTVEGHRIGSTTLEEHSTDAYRAVDAAVARLARTVRRALSRVSRQSRRSGASIRRSA